MTCEEFEELVQRSLDGSISRSDHARMDAHTQICPQCMELKRSLAALDHDLWNLPQPEIPMSLMKALEQIPASAPALGGSLSWKPELLRASLLAVGGLCLALFFDQLQTEWRALGQLVLGTGGFFLFSLSLLHPIFLPAASGSRGPR